MVIDWYKRQRICFSTKVQNFLRNFPQAMLAFLRLFSCIQAGAELGQANLKLKLGCASIRICFIKLMIAKCYQLIHITEHDYPVLGTTNLIIHYPFTTLLH